MGSYMMMLYVSLEQEQALKQFFIDKGWKYRKPDPSCFTDELGPITGSVPASSTPVKVKLSSSQSNTPPVHQIQASSRITRSKREHDNYKHMDESCMDIGDNYMEGDEDDDYIENDLKEGNQESDVFLAKLDGTIDDSPDMTPVHNDVENTVRYEDETSMDGLEKIDGDISSVLHTILPLKYQCGQCLVYVTSRKQLNEHLKGECEEVTISTSSDVDRADEAGDHIGSMLQQGAVDVSVSTSDTRCNVEMHDKSSMTQLDEVHFSQMCFALRCDQCSKTLSSTTAYVKHKKKTHNVIICYRPDKQFKCELCEKVFNRKDSLKDHTRFVHLKIKPRKIREKPTERKFVCDFCGFAFLRKSNLVEHIACKHTKTGKTHICEECGESYIRPYQLEYHVNKVHRKTKPYQCDVCEKEFYSRVNLRQHRDMCVMDESKKFKCKICEKIFTRQNNLDMHMEALHSENPLQCECGMVIKWRSSMAKHKRRCKLNAVNRKAGDSAATITPGGKTFTQTVKHEGIDMVIDAECIVNQNTNKDMGNGVSQITTITTNSGQQVVTSAVANTLKNEGLLIASDLTETLKVDDSRVSVESTSGPQSVYYVILNE